MKELAANYQPVRNPETGRLNIDRTQTINFGKRPMGPSNKPAVAWSEMAKTEEGRAKLREWQRKSAAARSANMRHKALGYPPHVWRELQAKAQRKAKRLVKEMRVWLPYAECDAETDQKKRNRFANQAFSTLFEIMLLPGARENKLMAAKIILEFTLPKPSKRILVSPGADPIQFLTDLIEQEESEISDVEAEAYLAKIEAS